MGQSGLDKHAQRSVPSTTHQGLTDAMPYTESYKAVLQLRTTATETAAAECR
eukprot:CAMPEP_0181210112 /NCGR_PEP_ID=MMETSP1096-20121128/23047_1 /TAXON_ID=156174 ORGANISM="Chrysochromulina ericina, Strain CCMP281" /NCGR_SAMPLE_ID=MMETSP1096 /ASSEMBLY_ACC=CAM_ASM_000453 /LENGTH=51 /DNA_ID=CAMNT_0023301361 /DNA_START=272 /DNA_END=427 /DNA_ORIENTATION=-